MSRHGYIDDTDDNWADIRYRGAVKSALRGKRGQALLKDTLAALDAMPKKALIEGHLQDEQGDVCALGACALHRGMTDLHKLDPEEPDEVAAAFGVAAALIREITYMNDDWWQETPEHRWQRMRDWIAKQIRTQ